MNILFSKPIWVVILFLGALHAACVSDPWPEPDDGPSAADKEENTSPDLESDEDYVEESDNGSWESTDTSTDYAPADSGDTTDTHDDTESNILGPIAQQIYCSAPGPDGMVTLVALAGSILVDADIMVVGDVILHMLKPGPDGGFVDRIEAGPGESLLVAVREKGTDRETRVTVETGTRDGDYVSDAIWGDGTVTVLNGVDQAIVHGEGGRLDDQYLVVGGNRQRATGRIAPVSCGGTPCTFDLIIPAGPGDSIDLFLVPLTAQAGHTDVQTVLVP